MFDLVKWFKCEPLLVGWVSEGLAGLMSDRVSNRVETVNSKRRALFVAR